METKTNRIENSVGWRLAIFGAIAIFGQFAFMALLNLILPGFAEKNVEDISLIAPIITVDIIGVPVILLLMKKIPTVELGNEKYSLGKFILGIPVMSFFVITGSLIGSLVQGLLSASSSAGLDTIITGSSFGWRVLYLGILAPVFEEVIFRKLLIDRLAARGKWFAIFVSALCFALFHGNFAQFFYAFALGFIWAVIYTRTGNIFISMGYHLIINLSTSVVGSVLMAGIDYNKPETLIPFYGYVGVRVVLAIIGCVILIITAKKIFRIEDEEGLKGKELFKAAFSSWGLWLHYLLCIAIFVYTIVATNMAATH